MTEPNRRGGRDLMEKFKPGDEITAVHTQSGERLVLLLKITKIARKYIHGTGVYVTANGTMIETSKTKVDPEKSDIYTGLRLDIRDAVLKHKEEVWVWERQKHKKKQEYERDFYLHVKKQVAEWEIDNPAPRPPEFPPPEMIPSKETEEGDG